MECGKGGGTGSRKEGHSFGGVGFLLFFRFLFIFFFFKKFVFCFSPDGTGENSLSGMVVEKEGQPASCFLCLPELTDFGSHVFACEVKRKLKHLPVYMEAAEVAAGGKGPSGRGISSEAVVTAEVQSAAKVRCSYCTSDKNNIILQPRESQIPVSLIL